ncbi:TRM11 family SAM-dependent methyltransferase [Auraticoccus monumenti]|uniref:RNA methylase family UPF0020 n=1 Tax=Auraticoccus monumenti TaxID=675864 RepID=A0A1G6RVW0_9ACTN|nr:SAM-dependent methyltransferase [Auraticoccus monumenti]SDD08075.1 hypothetical protein SAMN04489747_0118 [Auraticoccus monumenti]
MTTYLMMIAPSGNRVYAAGSAPLAAAELEVCAGHVLADVRPLRLAGADYLAFETDQSLDEDGLALLAGQSLRLAVFERTGDAEAPLLRPVEVPEVDLLDDDLVSIPKYPGKTNELFTRMLLNVTLAQVRRSPGEDGRFTVLDPLCGRGTTLTTAWLAGHHGAGVEGDEKAVEQGAAFLRTWLRRKRLKHTAEVRPVRRDGKVLGRRLEVEVRPEGTAPLQLTVLTGDTRRSAELYGKRRFDAVVTDAPYGVVHGSQTDVRGVSGRRDRSPAGLLREAIPVWASQLRQGGALGLSWNTFGLAREDLLGLLADAGLEPLDGGPWHRFSHRVDSSIQRDLVVATKPAATT